MKTPLVSFNDPSLAAIPVRPGERFVWLYDVGCRDGKTLSKGSIIEVLEKTNYSPHNEMGPRGHNWICKAENGVTVWATLEHCLDRELLRRV